MLCCVHNHYIEISLSSQMIVVKIRHNYDKVSKLNV